MNQTLDAFDYPESTLAETDHWVVMLRPKQVTLGSLVLAIRDPDTRSMGALSPQAAAELPVLTGAIEAVLKAELKAEKFNYLCLMMVDPQVHFHVLPRYSMPISFANQDFFDTSWPAPPDLRAAPDMPPNSREQLQDTLKHALILRLAAR